MLTPACAKTNPYPAKQPRSIDSKVGDSMAGIVSDAPPPQSKKINAIKSLNHLCMVTAPAD
jgi:hypothetical protein